MIEIMDWTINFEEAIQLALGIGICLLPLKIFNIYLRIKMAEEEKAKEQSK